MMKLKNQVCSLKLAEKLKKLGYPQKGLFWWSVYYNLKTNKPNYNDGEIHYGKDMSASIHFDYVAPTVAELGEIMKEKGMGTTAYSTLVKKEWWVSGGIWDVGKQKYDGLETDKTWANALAKMLIYLLENKLLEELKGEGK